MKTNDKKVVTVMKKTMIAMTLVITLLISLSIYVFATAEDQPQIQIQQQDRDQTNINDAEQEQARLQLRDKLSVTDQSRIEQQDRFRQQTHSQLCFPDIEQHWAMEQIRSAYNWGLVNGYPDGRYNPNGNISGVEGVIMMNRMINCLAGELPGTGSSDDVDWNQVPLWAREQMMEAGALRIASQSQFYGEEQLNRLQFAVMLAKALGVATEVPEGTEVFLDQDSIPTGDLQYVYALRILGVVIGNDGNFHPEHMVTRAEAATMLSRVLETLE